MYSPLVPKLSHLASNLSTWNKEVFGNLFKRKRTLWARIEGLQRRLNMGAPRYLLKLERKLRLELNQTLAQIAMLWFQKSREDQIRDGDRNTKYFHTATIIRRRLNHVHAIKDGTGEWHTDPSMIKQLFVAHFRALFSEDNSGQSVLGQTQWLSRIWLNLSYNHLKNLLTNRTYKVPLGGCSPLKPRGRTTSMPCSSSDFGILLKMMSVKWYFKS